MKFRAVRATVLRALATLGVAALFLNGCAADTSGTGDDSFEEANDYESTGGLCDEVCLHADSPADFDVEACFDDCATTVEDDEYRNGLDGALAACNNDWRCLCRVLGIEYAS